MRLLNVDTFQLEFIHEYNIVAYPYAILSHTWGEDEITISQLQDLERARKHGGFQKIQNTCQQAKADGLRYAWIDTCCIDKSSSSELQEAINSMFRWYKQSKVCYAYLSDVSVAELGSKQNIESAFLDSRWFTRGWTLQELIAPRSLVFFDSKWKSLGTRADRAAQISTRIRIPKLLLAPGASERSFGSPLRVEDLNMYSVAERMSWAAQRETRKIEDQAYCLLGLFAISMPLLYGEGPAAFTRLQEEILRTNSDLSILLWTNPSSPPYDPSATEISGLLAPSPRAFQHCQNIQFVPTKQLLKDTTVQTISGFGFRINTQVAVGTAEHGTYVVLNCYDKLDPTHAIVLRAGTELTDQSSGLRRPEIDDSISDTLVLSPGTNAWRWDTVNAGLKNRTARIDAVTVDEQTMTRNIILTRSAQSLTEIFGGSTAIDEFVWIRWTSIASGAAWQVAEIYPSEAWHCTASSVYCGPLQAFQTATKHGSRRFAFGAISLRKSDVHNSRVAVAFARQRRAPMEDQRKSTTTLKDLYIAVENITKQPPDHDQSLLEQLCRKVRTRIIPAEDKAEPTNYRHEAKGVQLYDGHGISDGFAFAIKPEIRIIGSNRMIILHIHDLRSLHDLEIL